jgi:hypothetical protein
MNSKPLIARALVSALIVMSTILNIRAADSGLLPRMFFPHCPKAN